LAKRVIFDAELAAGGMSTTRKGFSPKSISCKCMCIYTCGSDKIEKLADGCRVTDFEITM